MVSSHLRPLLNGFNIYRAKFGNNPLLVKKFLSVISVYDALLTQIRKNKFLIVNQVRDPKLLYFCFFMSLDIECTPICNTILNFYRKRWVFAPLLKFLDRQKAQRTRYLQQLKNFTTQCLLNPGKNVKTFVSGIAKGLKSSWLTYFKQIKFLKFLVFYARAQYIYKLDHGKFLYEDLYNLADKTKKSVGYSKRKYHAQYSLNLMLSKIYLLINPYLSNCSLDTKRDHYANLYVNSSLYVQIKNFKFHFFSISQKYLMHQLKHRKIISYTITRLAKLSSRHDTIRNICFLVFKKIYKRFIKKGRKLLAQKFFNNFLRSFKYTSQKPIYTIFFNFITKVKRGLTVRPMFKSGITYQIPFALTFSKYLYFTIVYLLNQIKNDTNLTKCYTILREILVIYTTQKIKKTKYSKKIYYKNHIFNNKMLKYCKYIKTHQSYLNTMFPF